MGVTVKTHLRIKISDQNPSCKHSHKIKVMWIEDYLNDDEGKDY